VRLVIRASVMYFVVDTPRACAILVSRVLASGEELVDDSIAPFLKTTNIPWQRVDLTHVVKEGSTDAAFGQSFQFQIALASKRSIALMHVKEIISAVLISLTFSRAASTRLNPVA
jgi:hypothetical protein